MSKKKSIPEDIVVEFAIYAVDYYYNVMMRGQKPLTMEALLRDYLKGVKHE